VRSLPDVREVPRVSVHAAAAPRAQGTRMTASSPLPAIIVLAAIVERDGHLLVTRRIDGTHLAGLWEFPGGKCEAGETHEACLAREIMEELGVAAVVGAEVLVTEHTYAERTVRLHFRRCEIAGTPRALLGQQMQWVRREDLRTLEFPEADAALIARLTATT
jgi:mutator protein MutT